LVDLGVDAQISDRLVLYLNYAVQAGQSNYFGQSIEGGVKVGF
jgi:outer membrane autotransporter protein